MNDIVKVSKRPVNSPHGFTAPAPLTISAGQWITGLECLQHDRLDKFVKANPKLFVYHTNRDAAEYIGPDATIP